MTICDCFRPKDKVLLKRYSIDSQNEMVEHGASITKACSVGPPVKGKPDSVKVPRPENTIGSYHSHWIGQEAKPSLVDLSEMLAHGDEAMCIGVGKRPAEVSCFYPRDKELFNTLGWLVRGLREDLNEFTFLLKRKYGEVTYKTEEDRIRLMELQGRARTLSTKQGRYWEYLGECKV